MTLPRHTAFIMDGNGRWAQARGLPRSAGHKAGFEHIPDVLEICQSLGIQTASAYAWSTENWDRPAGEVQFIVQSLEEELPRFVNQLHQRKVRFICSGSRQSLSERARQVIEQGEALTCMHHHWTFNLAFNYGGRAELVDGIRRMVVQGVQPDEVSEARVKDFLWTGSLPDVDLVVRTGGNQRLSNFLLWRSAFARVYIVDHFWPDIDQADITSVVDQFRQRIGDRL